MDYLEKFEILEEGFKKTLATLDVDKKEEMIKFFEMIVNDADQYTALENGGVDNWDYVSDSIKNHFLPEDYNDDEYYEEGDKYYDVDVRDYFYKFSED